MHPRTIMGPKWDQVSMKIEFGFPKPEYIAWRYPIATKLTKCCLCLTCPPCFCCISCLRCLSHASPCGTGRRMAARRKPVDMLDVYFERREHHLKRRKSLSGPAGPVLHDPVALRKKRYSQAQSPMFSKLPAEVRIRIYEMVLCSEEFLHLVVDWRFVDNTWSRCGRLAINDCVMSECHSNLAPEDEGTAWDCQHYKCMARDPLAPYSRGYYHPPPDKARFMFLPMLQACRRM